MRLLPVSVEFLGVVWWSAFCEPLEKRFWDSHFHQGVGRSIAVTWTRQERDVIEEAREGDVRTVVVRATTEREVGKPNGDPSPTEITDMGQGSRSSGARLPPPETSVLKGCDVSLGEIARVSPAQAENFAGQPVVEAIGLTVNDAVGPAGSTIGKHDTIAIQDLDSIRSSRREGAARASQSSSSQTDQIR